MHYIEPYLQAEVGTGPCGNSASEMCPLAVAQRRCEQPSMALTFPCGRRVFVCG